MDIILLFCCISVIIVHFKIKIWFMFVFIFLHSINLLQWRTRLLVTSQFRDLSLCLFFQKSQAWSCHILVSVSRIKTRDSWSHSNFDYHKVNVFNSSIWQFFRKYRSRLCRKYWSLPSMIKLYLFTFTHTFSYKVTWIYLHSEGLGWKKDPSP